MDCSPPALFFVFLNVHLLTTMSCVLKEAAQSDRPKLSYKQVISLKQEPMEDVSSTPAQLHPSEGQRPRLFLSTPTHHSSLYHQMCMGSAHTPSRSLRAESPVVELNFVTVYLELVSDPTV